MKIKCLLLAVFVSFVAFAEQSFSLTDDITFRLGGEIRARYEGYNSATVNPDLPKNHRHHTEYFRNRTKIYGALDFGEHITINISLANRFQYVMTSPSNPNNNDAATWEFPDEVYIDQANVVLKDIFDTGISLTIGRQNLSFGNGMIISEGTPYDQGRSVYFDGINLQYDSDLLKLAAFVLYDRWKDGSVFINDRNRRLRSGDIFTVGTYNTINVSDIINFDVYYIFNDQDDNHPNEIDAIERAHAVDASVRLHTVGARIFGKIKLADKWGDFIAYSLEGAGQFGRDADGNHIKGNMLDARLQYFVDESWNIKPSAGVEFTHFSGDTPGDGDNRSWNPLMSQCPLWGEELMPIMLNSVWSNLNMIGGNVSIKPTQKSRFTLYATDYYADDSDGFVGANVNTGNGRHVGSLFGGNLQYEFLKDYSMLSSLVGQVYVSYFIPGSFFTEERHCTWFRVEVTAKF